MRGWWTPCRIWIKVCLTVSNSLKVRSLLDSAPSKTRSVNNLSKKVTRASRLAGRSARTAASQVSAKSRMAVSLLRGLGPG